MKKIINFFIVLCIIGSVFCITKGLVLANLHLNSDRQTFLRNKFNTDDIRIINRDYADFIVKDPTNNFVWEVNFDVFSRGKAVYKKIF